MKKYLTLIALSCFFTIASIIVGYKTDLIPIAQSQTLPGGLQAITPQTGDNWYNTTPALLSLPDDYNSTSKSYPLLIFLHGSGEASSTPDLAKIYNNSAAGGPSYFIANGTWPSSFTNPADGQQYKFIVISPQAGWFSTTGSTLNVLIQTLVKTYRVDPNRIYLTGLSAGAQGIVSYVTHADYQFGMREIDPVYPAAAQVPMSLADDPNTITQSFVNTTIADNVPTWGFGSESSDIYGAATRLYVQGKYGNYTQPATGLGSLGRYTSYPGGHCCWNNFYNPAYRETINGKSMNIYEWMLQFKRDGSTPTVNMQPSANAGADQTVALPTNIVTLSGSGSDRDGSVASYAWTKTSGTGGTIQSSSSASTTVTGLTQGTYTFRLTVTDNQGATGFDDVTVTVNAVSLPSGSIAPYGGTPRAIPGTIQAEDFDTGGEGAAYHDADASNVAGKYRPSDGIDIENTADASGTYDIGWTNDGEWMKYTVSVATSGPYTIDARIAAPGNTGSLQVEMDGNIVATINVPSTGGYQSWQTATATNVSLTAGTHVMRLYEKTAGYNINYITFTQAATPTSNVAPNANAGADKSITFPTNSVTLNGSGSDQDGSIVSYAWTKVSGTGGTIASPSNATTNITNLSVGSYIFRLTVTDNQGATNTDDVNVTVAASNAPTGDTTTYRIDFGSSGKQTVSTGWNNIINPSNTGIPTTLVNTTGALSSRKIQITDSFYYNPNLPTDSSVNENGTSASGLYPATATGDSFFLGNLNGITDNSAALTISGLSNANTYDFKFYASRVAGDGSNRTGNYTIGGTTTTLNAIDNVNGIATINAVSPANGSITLSISKAAAASYGYLGVLEITEHGTVVNTPTLNNAPTANAGNDQSITLPTATATLTGSGTDSDGSIVSYAWTKVSGTGGTIASPSAATTSVTNLTQGTYTFRLTVTDNQGATNTDDVNIVVNATNTAGKGNRIAIDPATMVINDNVVGDERKLFDEQDTLVLDANGDPVQSATPPRDCGDFWSEPKGQHKCYNLFDTEGVREVSYPPTLTVDLKANYKVTDVYIYRTTGNQYATTDLFEVRSGTPFHFDTKIGGTKLNYTVDQWVRIPMADNDTRFLQLLITPDAGTIKEVVIYGVQTGSKVNDAVSPVTQAQHYTMDTLIGTNVSYGMGDGYDKDYDEQWGTLRSYSGLQYQFDKNDNILIPQLGTYAGDLLKRQVSSGEKVFSVLQGIPLSMVDPNNPGTGNDHKPIDYTLCAGTIVVEGVPTCHGIADKPDSYAHKAWLAKKFAAAYGPSSNSQYAQDYVELGNEPDGSWNKAGYFTPFELAAMLSADYDGHCDTIRYNGQSVGVKNGDPNMKVVMPGLASVGDGDMRYLEAMNYWWKYNRPCSPTVPVDVFNVHFYSTSDGQQGTGTTGYGLSPEDYGMRAVMEKFTDFRNKYAPKDDVAITEFGYDSYPQTFPADGPSWCQNTVYGGSIIAARPIGSADSDEVAGEWMTRSYLEMAAAGIDFADQFWLADEYKLNTVCGTFAASGMLKQAKDAINYRPQYTARPAWYYTQTLRTQLKGMKYESDKKVNGITVMKFRDVSDKDKVAYVVWSPTSNGYTNDSFTLGLDRAATAQVVKLAVGTETGQIAQTTQATVSNLVIPVSERPIIVVANESGAPIGTGTGTLAANAGTDQSIVLPTNSVTLTGSGTGTIASYAWTLENGNGGTIVSPTAATTTVSGLTEGSYIFRLTVTDTSGASAFDDVLVVVNASPNNPPHANAGVDQTITLPTTTATLTGSGTDTDGSIVTYAWTKLSGNGTIVSPTSATTLVIGLTGGSSTFHLTVTDNKGSIATDDVVITVSSPSNSAPIVSAGIDKGITLPIATVTLAATATDPNGDAMTYSWTKMSGGTAIIASPMALSTAITGLISGTYTFRFTATDSKGASTSDDVTVTVSGPVVIANIPPVVVAGTDQTITLPTDSVTLSGTATDADGSITSYAWTKTSGTPMTFSTSTTASTTVTGLTEGTYVFTLTATDDKGASGSATVTVTVRPEPSSGGGGGGGGGGSHSSHDHKPTADAGNDVKIALPIDSVVLVGSGSDAEGNVTYEWSKEDGSGGDIEYPNRSTTTVKGLRKGSYTFKLTVTDSDGNEGSDTVEVTVLAADSGQLPSPANTTGVLGESTANSTSRVTIHASRLNVRTSPISGSVVTQVTNGASGVLLSTQNGWYQVRFTNGIVGWVSGAFATVATASTSSSGSGSTARVTATSLNVRSSPVSGPVITKLLLNTPVTVLATANGWSQIQLSNGTGWVSSAYLAQTTTTPPPPTGPTSGGSGSSARVTANSLNVRSAPVSGSVISRLTLNSTVTVIATANGWSQIQLPTGGTGWVSSAYLANTGSTTPVYTPTTGGFSVGDTVRTIASMLNVRTSAGGALVGKVANGTTGTILSISGSWAQVHFISGIAGYVSTAYLSK